jgi:hypothetical protein
MLLPGSSSTVVILLFSSGKVFTGAGHFDGLTEARLRHHLRQPAAGHKHGGKQDPWPRAPSHNPKIPYGGPLRWHTGDAVVRVAALIARHGEALDAALACDWPREALPNDAELIAALQAANASLTSQRDDARRIEKLALDAQRKSLERLQQVRRCVTEAKRQGREDVACQRHLCEAAAGETKRQLTAQFEETDRKRQATTHAATERTLAWKNRLTSVSPRSGQQRKRS